jgi:hypothetical protein
MNTSTHSAKKAPLYVLAADNAEDSGVCLPAGLARLFDNGVQRMVELEKVTLDMAVQFNAEALELNQMLFTPATPGVFLFQWAGQVFRSYVEIQKSLLNLMIVQSTAAADVTAKTFLTFGASTAAPADSFERGMDVVIGASENALQGVSRQREATVPKAA